MVYDFTHYMQVPIPKGLAGPKGKLILGTQVWPYSAKLVLTIYDYLLLSSANPKP